MGKTYSVKQVAEILGYSTNSIYSFLKEGQIIGIRLGKGRYRVAQEELDKILHLKKSTTPSVSSLTSEEIPLLDRHISTIRDSIPRLFDWFISLVCIVMGLTSILFVRNFEQLSKVPLSEFLLPIKINFLVAGLGLFLINLFNQARRKIFFIFYFIIFLNFLTYSIILFLGKDIMGCFFFILTSIMIFLHTVFNIKGSTSFSILITALTVLSPIIMFLFPSVIDLAEIVNAIGLEQNLIILFWSVLVVIANLLIWLSKKEKKSIYWISFSIVSICLGYFAYLYSIQLYWGRAFVYVLLVIFLFILSFWDEISENNDKIQKISRIFINITLIFLIAITIIGIIQKNIHSYAQNELTNKLVYGRNSVESIIANSQNKLEILAKNKLLIDSIKKDDPEILNRLIKDAFIYTSTFRGVVVADENGDLLTNYPLAEINYKNIAFRDYFKLTQEEKKSNLSNIFQTSADGQKKYVVTINVPILDDENNFQGILIGSLDIISIANQLQEVTNLKDNEYFIMVDKTGELIVSPENVNKLSQTEIDELVKGVSKGINIEETNNLENKVLQIHDKVNNTEWTIAIRRPLFNTFNLDNLTNSLVILSLVGFSLLISYFSIYQLKR